MQDLNRLEVDMDSFKCHYIRETGQISPNTVLPQLSFPSPLYSGAWLQQLPPQLFATLSRSHSSTAQTLL